MCLCHVIGHFARGLDTSGGYYEQFYLHSGVSLCDVVSGGLCRLGDGCLSILWTTLLVYLYLFIYLLLYVHMFICYILMYVLFVCLLLLNGVHVG